MHQVIQFVVCDLMKMKLLDFFYKNKNLHFIYRINKTLWLRGQEPFYTIINKKNFQQKVTFHQKK